MLKTFEKLVKKLRQKIKYNARRESAYVSLKLKDVNKSEDYQNI